MPIHGLFMSKEKEHEFPQINHESIMNLSVDCFVN